MPGRATSMKPPVVSAPADWPAAQVEMWKIGRIRPYDKNPRTHPAEQISKLAASMRDDGVTMPILVDEAGVIIAGHGRLSAAQKNGFEQYPVVIAHGWTEDRKQAARLKDNALGLLSGWDIPLLRQSIVDLQGFNYDISRLGFGDIQLKDWGIGIADLSQMPVLPTGERSPFQQMTFILHASQVLVVNEAIKIAMAQVKKSKRNSDNRNKNGLALVAICRSFIAGRPRPKSKKKNARRAKR